MTWILSQCNMSGKWKYWWYHALHQFNVNKMSISDTFSPLAQLTTSNRPRARANDAWRRGMARIIIITKAKIKSKLIRTINFYQSKPAKSSPSGCFSSSAKQQKAYYHNVCFQIQKSVVCVIRMNRQKKRLNTCASRIIDAQHSLVIFCLLISKRTRNRSYETERTRRKNDII